MPFFLFHWQHANAENRKGSRRSPGQRFLIKGSIYTVNPEKYMQNSLYLLDMLIFASNIVQRHYYNDYVCMHILVRRVIAFIRFSRDLRSKMLKNTSQYFISHINMGPTEEMSWSNLFGMRFIFRTQFSWLPDKCPF
jgi:hypothetical protein